MISLLGALACAPAPRASTREAASPGERSPSGSRIERLAVDGFHDAIVSVPAARDARPVLIATHGAGGTAEGQCAAWASLIRDRGWVLCPNGTPFSAARDAGPAAFYRNHHALERELHAAIGALHRRFADALPGRYVYAGFSQGAIMGALVAMKHPEDFPRLILIEGGGGDWNVATSQKLASAGNARVLFACGVAECNQRANRSARWLTRAGVAVRVEYATGAGHTDSGPVGERVAAALEWVLDGDERWRR